MGITAVSAGVIAAYVAIHGVPKTCKPDRISCRWVIPAEEWKPGGMFHPNTNPLLKGISINYPPDNVDVRKDCDHLGLGVPKHCGPPPPTVSTIEPKSIYLLIAGLFCLYVTVLLTKRKNKD